MCLFLVSHSHTQLSKNMFTTRCFVAHRREKNVTEVCRSFEIHVVSCGPNLPQNGTPTHSKLSREVERSVNRTRPDVLYNKSDMSSSPFSKAFPKPFTEIIMIPIPYLNLPGMPLVRSQSPSFRSDAINTLPSRPLDCGTSTGSPIFKVYLTDLYSLNEAALAASKVCRICVLT
jgi:hypothetical protein